MKKHAESHMDHGFTQGQWDFIFAKYADKTAFFIDTFELPEHLGTVTNELYGPAVGDPPIAEADVFYGKRGDRVWPSRLTTLPKRPTRFVRVIAGPHEETCLECFGGGTVFEDGPWGREERRCLKCDGARVLKYACILYTAYGVASIDVAASPKEPGDLQKQIAEVTVRYEAGRLDGTHTLEDHELLHKLYAQLEDSRAFWSQHALAREAV